MNPCIVVKGVQFQHQLLFTGRGDEGRCHFCQQSVANRQQHTFELALAEQWRSTRFPEGAEL